VPSAISECVRSSTVQATAAEFIPLPSMEMTLAAKNEAQPPSLLNRAHDLNLAWGFSSQLSAISSQERC